MLNDHTRRDFVQVELKLAFTFCRLAKSPNCLENLRCVRKARTAYDAAVHFSPWVDMSAKEWVKFTANAERVRLMVEDLETLVLESRLGVIP